MSTNEGTPNGDQAIGYKNVTSAAVALKEPDVIEQALAPKPFLSLCMIVRDGERTLPELFESIHGIFDEIVVVDTGSIDNTRPIVEAAAYGADFGDLHGLFAEAPLSHDVQPGEGTVANRYTDKFGTRWVLAHFGWCDDFSKARNFSFGLATGKWRMYLDADDRIEFRGPERHKGKPIDLKAVIRRMVEKNPKINVVQMPYDYIDGVSKEMKPRIVLWERGFSWRFPIHEQFFLNDKNADATSMSKGTRFSGQIDDLHVVHNKTLEEHEKSANRNAQMIARALENVVDDETHSHLLFHHALSLFQMQDYAGGDRILVFIEKTLEGSTFWLQARRQRIMAQALFLKDLDVALDLAGGLYSHLPELRDGPNYIGWVHALRRNWPRAADSFDIGKHLVVPYAYVEDQWMSEGAHVAAQALAYAHIGRVDEARPLLDVLKHSPVRDHDAVHDMRTEADRVCMKVMCYRRVMDHVDALLWSSQPREAIAALVTAPANVREMPQVQERIRHTERLIAHLASGEAYSAAYSAPSDKYHSYSHDVLLTERAMTMFDWADNLEKDGPPIHVLSIGSHDALIEDVLLEKSERIFVTVCDVSANANSMTDQLVLKYPGRVEVHVMDPLDPYDWGDGQFDVVMCFEVIEHVPDAVRAAHRLASLAEGGRLFVSTPIADRWVEQHLASAERTEPAWHVRSFTGPSLWALMKEARAVKNDSTLVEGRDATLVFDSGDGYEHQHPQKIEIVIPMTPVPFDAVSPEHGFLGGSEEAVVRLARALSNAGHEVVVYAPEKRRDGARMIGWDGVLWRSADEFDAGAPRDKNVGVVFWRCPHQVAQYKAYTKVRGDDFSYKKFLWTHDAVYNATTEQYEAVDKILTLSEHHNKTLEADGAPKERFLYFPNGIDAPDFPELDDGGVIDTIESKRDSHKVIYASSPDRGLARLLNIWDNVREAVPDATLDIYYAWDLAKKLNPKMIADFEARIDELKDKGVIYHGGIDQPSLHDAYRRSGVWAYPNAGKVETFCCHPDTMISIPGDHAAMMPPRIRIADLAGKTNVPVYTYDQENLRFKIGTMTKCWKTKVATEMVHITLDDGSVLRLTPEHLVCTFEDEWVKAGDLAAGDRLMALHVLYDVMIRDRKGGWTRESRLVGEWKNGGPLPKGVQVDHEDLTRLDNRPHMLNVLTKSQHSSKTHKAKTIRKKQVQAALKALAKDRAENPEKTSALRTAAAGGLWQSVAAMTVDERAAFLKKREKARQDALKRRRYDPTYKPKRRTRKERDREKTERRGRGRRNHHITKIERVYDRVDVYDMEVEGTHTFVADGVVVHNCISAVKAMAAGAQPVTTTAGAIAEVVDRHGVIIPEGHWDLYEAALIRALQEPATVEQRKAARAYAIERFSWASTAERLIEYIRDM